MVKLPLKSFNLVDFVPVLLQLLLQSRDVTVRQFRLERFLGLAAVARVQQSHACMSRQQIFVPSSGPIRCLSVNAARLSIVEFDWLDLGLEQRWLDCIFRGCLQMVDDLVRDQGIAQAFLYVPWVGVTQHNEPLKMRLFLFGFGPEQGPVRFISFLD